MLEMLDCEDKEGIDEEILLLRINRLPPGQSAFHYVFARYRKAAQDRGYDFAVPRGDFYELTQRECYYCGSPPSNRAKGQSENSGHFVYSGVDRVDNEQGYVMGNVVPCCARCNRAKGSMTESEFVNMARKISRYYSGSGDGSRL